MRSEILRTCLTQTLSKFVLQFRFKDTSEFQLRLHVQAQTFIFQDHLEHTSQFNLRLYMCSGAVLRTWHKLCAKLMLQLRFRDASEFKLSCATCENSCSRITWNINLSQCSLHLYMCSEALSELAWRERSERMIAQFRSKDNSGFQLRLRVQAKTVECILQDHLKRKSQSMFPLSVCSEALSELAWHKQCERIILRLRQWNSFSRITWSRTLIQWQNQKELARRNAVKS